jgi:hypothetical protein
MERVAATQPAHCQPRSPQRTVQLHGLERVRATRRVEPAPGSQQRTDKPPVEVQQPHEQPASSRQLAGFPARRGAHRLLTPPCRRSKAPITRSRSAARSAWQAVAARGAARTTRRLPPGSDPRYPRARCRNRRLTVFRATAEPTDRLTMKPTLAGSSLPGLTSRCPETSDRPARLPRRVAEVKSALRRILAAAGSMTPARREPSDANAVAALAAAGGQDRASSAGPHPQPEAVGLGPAPVVRLKSTLAHWNSRCGRSVD